MKLNATFNNGKSKNKINKKLCPILPINYLVNRFFNNGNNPILKRIKTNYKSKSLKKHKSSNSTIVNVVDFYMKPNKKIRKNNSSIIVDSMNYKKIYEKFLIDKKIFNKVKDKELFDMKKCFNSYNKKYNILYNNIKAIKEDEQRRKNFSTIEQKDEINQKDEEEDLFYKNQKNFYKVRKDIIEEPELENEID